jgi:hypothetical protein
VLCEHEFYVGVTACGHGFFLSWSLVGVAEAEGLKTFFFFFAGRKDRGNK